MFDDLPNLCMYCYPAKVEKVDLGPSFPNPVVQIAPLTQIIGMYVQLIWGVTGFWVLSKVRIFREATKFEKIFHLKFDATVESWFKKVFGSDQNLS